MPIPAVCDVLINEGARKLGTSAFPYTFEKPALAATTLLTGPEAAALVYAATPQGGMDAVPYVAHSFFEAWGDWPATDLPAGLQSFPMTEVAVGESYEGGELYAAMIAHDQLEFLPRTGNGAYPIFPILESFARPLFVTRGSPGSDAFAIGYTPNESQLVFGRADNLTGTFEAIADSGCAVTPISAAGVQTSNGFWVAFSSSRPFGTCLDDNGQNTAATEVQVASLAGGAPPKLITSLVDESPDAVIRPIVQVGMAKTNAGIWVVWKHEMEIEVFGALLDETGLALTPPTAIGTTGAPDDPVGVTGLGDYLVLASTMYVKLDPHVRVTLIDASGAEHASGSAFGASLPKPPHALLASPLADRFIVAFGDDTGSLHATRFRCVLRE